MSEQNIKKFYETLARIISEREQVKITVSVSKKEKAEHKDKKRMTAANGHPCVNRCRLICFKLRIL